MSIDEIVRRLEDWKAKQEELDRQYQALHKLTGAAPDSELCKAMFDMSNAYTESVSELVGDKWGWLSWFQYDCDMGKRQKLVKLSNGCEIKVRTLRQLARVISDD